MCLIYTADFLTNEKNQDWRESSVLYKFMQYWDVVDVSLNTEYLISTAGIFAQHAFSQHQNAIAIPGSPWK